MDEIKKNKILEMCRAFTKKHGPEIMVGLGVSLIPFAVTMRTWKPKDKAEYAEVPKQVVEENEHRYKMKLSEESRKYANWIPYEKETSIYDAYNEFKSTEDFG